MSERLLIILQKLKTKHYECDDCYYSCPKCEEGCCNEYAEDECNCGADEQNALVDEAMNLLSQLTAERDELKLAVAQTELDISAWKNICTEWYKDAERLAGAETDIYSEGDEEYISCVHSGSCGSHVYRRRSAEFIHSPNCPITLHRQLCEKYEASPCHE